MISSSFDSTIFKRIGTGNFFPKNSRNCPTLVMYYVSSIGASFLVIFLPNTFGGPKFFKYPGISILVIAPRS
jgi:hypothetical protein